MSSDFVISSLLLITAFTCREVAATCNMTSDTVTTCSMDAGPLKKLFIPVDGSIGECRCNIKLVESGQGIQQTIIRFSNHMISKPNCPYKITFMDYNYTISCEKSETLNIPVTKERSTVLSITKDSSLTTTGGFCVNMTILQEKFNISCRLTSISGTTKTDLTTSTETTVPNTNKDPSTTGEDIMTTTKDVATSISGTTETDLTTSAKSTVLTTNKDHSITGEDHKQTNMMTTTKDVLLNTSGVTSPANTNGIIISNYKPSDEAIKEFPVTAVAGGIAGVVVVIIIIIIIVFIWYLKSKNNIYDTPVQRRRDEHVYGNIQTRSLENLDISGQREDRSQGSPPRHTSDVSAGYNDSNPVASSEKPETFPSKKANNGETMYENIASDL